MQTTLINIEDLNMPYELKLLIGGVILSIIIGTITLILNYWLNKDEPNFVMLEDISTGEFYISEKKWYGYVCIKTFKDKEIAEIMCTTYNKAHGIS